SGHFVVVCGYEPSTQSVRIADPLLPNPMADGQYYTVGMNRLIGAIYLGVLTYDANFLVVEPRERTR
ncbi:MAG TPA: peptidase-C39 like family protein, partial [Vicinamibacteria bacterium]|nr:peptidase-C39 like family protein [Vicinamibacteria bacterium]